MLHDEMLCGGTHSSLFWTSIPPGPRSKQKAPGFSITRRTKETAPPRLMTEGPEFPPCPFSGGAAWFFLPPVERYLVLFAADLSIALDPNSGCRARPLSNAWPGVKQGFSALRSGTVPYYRSRSRVMEWNHKSFRSMYRLNLQTVSRGRSRS